MLMQVLSLTPDQINSLPPSEREAIQNLVCLTRVLFGHFHSLRESAINFWEVSQHSGCLRSIVWNPVEPRILKIAAF